jgi:hypothetical protein
MADGFSRNPFPRHSRSNLLQKSVSRYDRSVVLTGFYFMIADILLLLTFLFPRHEEAFLILANFEMHGENDLRRFAQTIVVASATADNR